MMLYEATLPTKTITFSEGEVIDKPSTTNKHHQQIIIKGTYGELDFVCNLDGHHEDWFCIDILTDTQKAQIIEAIRASGLSFCKRTDLTKLTSPKAVAEKTELIWFPFWEKHCLTM